MRTLLLAATSTLALSGLALAQTMAPATTDTAPAVTTPGEVTGATGAPATTTAPLDATGTAATDATGMDATTTIVPATTDATTVTTTDVVAAAPNVDAPVLTADNPGMLGSWLMNRRIWTTNQPSSTVWESGQTLTERPADWTDIAKIDDIVVDADGNVRGYVADIGGFLGLGAKQVLLGKDALHLVHMGDDSFFVTNFTKDELQALPDFDTATVMK